MNASKETVNPSRWHRAACSVGAVGPLLFLCPPFAVASTSVEMTTGVLISAFAGAVGTGCSEYFNTEQAPTGYASKTRVAVMAAAGSVLCGALACGLMTARDEANAIDALPERNPHEVVEMKTETREIHLHEVVCKPNQGDRKIRITRDGRDYSIICP